MVSQVRGGEGGAIYVTDPSGMDNEKRAACDGAIKQWLACHLYGR